VYGKKTPVGDSRYVPCVQSDTREWSANPALRLVAAELASAAGGAGAGAGAGPAALRARAPGSSSDMTPAERQKYATHYASIDADGDGYISHEVGLYKFNPVDP
jgi:hypothetical protein